MKRAARLLNNYFNEKINYKTPNQVLFEKISLII